MDCRNDLPSQQTEQLPVTPITGLASQQYVKVVMLAPDQHFLLKARYLYPSPCRGPGGN